MPRKGSSFYEREFVAAKSRLLARMLARDPQTAMAMDLIIVATQVGADIGRLAEKTGFTIDQIRPLESRLREGLIWVGRTVDAREWLYLTSDRDRMLVLVTQALVGLGGLRRELVDGGAAYSYPDGHELGRFRIPDETRLLSRFERPRIGFEISNV